MACGEMRSTKRHGTVFSNLGDLPALVLLLDCLILLCLKLHVYKVHLFTVMLRTDSECGHSLV